MGADLPKETLLERLAKRSALRLFIGSTCARMGGRALRCPESIPVCEEERAQWNEAVRYISGKTLSFESAHSAWEFLRDYARKRKDQ